MGAFTYIKGINAVWFIRIEIFSPERIVAKPAGPLLRS